MKIADTETFCVQHIMVTALRAEAQPLIEHFELKQDGQSRQIPVYKGKGISLAISGVGKVRSAIATSALLSQDAKNERIAYNFGLCGSLQPEHDLGSLHLIHKITDAGTGRDFYPDILFKHGLSEIPLTTFDRPVDRSSLKHSHIDKGLEGGVDMEAAGFFSAAATFLPPERIVCCKLVSDHLEGCALDKRLIHKWIEGRLSALESVIQAAGRCVRCPEKVLGEADQALLDRLKGTLRLTATQGHQLQDWARAYVLHHGASVCFLNVYLKYTVRHKAERDRLLEKIRNELLAE